LLRWYFAGGTLCLIEQLPVIETIVTIGELLLS